MSRKPDLSLINKIYNNLRVDRLTDEYNSYNRRLYECTCLICGAKRLATKQNLQRNEIKDCGNHHDYNDLSSVKFGRLKPLYPVKKIIKTKNRSKLWHCVCDCEERA